jgi:hypothetical protein
METNFLPLGKVPLPLGRKINHLIQISLIWQQIVADLNRYFR